MGEPIRSRWKNTRGLIISQESIDSLMEPIKRNLGKSEDDIVAFLGEEYCSIGGAFGDFIEPQTWIVERRKL